MTADASTVNATERRGLRSFWKKDGGKNVTTRSLVKTTGETTLVSFDDSKHSDTTDPSSSSGGDDDQIVTTAGTGGVVSTDFVIQCEQGAHMVFVTALQGSTLLQRSKHFRSSLVKADGKVIEKAGWSLATTRRVIELLATERVWIERDSAAFYNLIDAGNEIGMELRIASLINYHDLMERADTDQFFDMIKLQRYQFRICAAVKSWQWMKLMRNGILLLSKAKVLMVKAVNVKSCSTVLDEPPSSQRLAKCDSIRSEFCVYADGKLNVLWTILELLRSAPEKKDVRTANNQVESFRLVYCTREGAMTQEQLDQMWRLSPATYMEATAEDIKYLDRASPISPLENDGNLYYRTISASSILVLRHLFDGINADSELPACLIVVSPTPDTLGRFINAAEASNETIQSHAEIGMHMERNIFFLPQTSSQIHKVLEGISNYSASAVVSKEFRMVEFKT